MLNAMYGLYTYSNNRLRVTIVGGTLAVGITSSSISRFMWVVRVRRGGFVVVENGRNDMRNQLPNALRFRSTTTVDTFATRHPMALVDAKPMTILTTMHACSRLHLIHRIPP